MGWRSHKPALRKQAKNYIDTVKENIETSFNASNEVGSEVNAQETKHMLPSRDQSSDHNLDIKIANRYFDNVGLFK
jgi:hypothetical protein